MNDSKLLDRLQLSKNRQKELMTRCADLYRKLVIEGISNTQLQREYSIKRAELSDIEHDIKMIQELLLQQ